MKKDEINNAIVLLRQAVRKARVCVTNKLVREAKKLRSKHGTETQLEKNRKKADRLLKEVFALKMIRDDEISKFGITNVRNLQMVLQDALVDDKIRVMARLACHKSLNEKLIEFKTKYPDYEKYASSVRSKTTMKSTVTKSVGDSLKSHANTRNKQIYNTPISIDNGAAKLCRPMDVERKNSIEALPVADLKNDPIMHPENDRKNSVKTQKIHDTKGAKDTKNSKSMDAISKEATVQRFEELLSTEKLAVDTDDLSEGKKDTSLGRSKEFERQIDDFFVCPGKENGYSSADKTFSSKVERKNWSTREIKNDRTIKIHSRSHGIKVTPQQQIRKDAAQKKKPEGHARSSRSTEEVETLHPSWVARKKQQEILKQGFQGKRIVFGED